MTAEQVYGRLEQVEQALLQRDDVPLFGDTPTFPWDIFASRVAHSLQTGDFTVKAGEKGWRNADSITDGIAADVTPLHFVFAPLPGTVCWLMNDSDLSLLMTEFLFKDTAKKVFDQNPSFKKGFQRFLAMEVLNILNDIQFAEGLAPAISSVETVPHEDAYCINVAITLGKQKAAGRLVVTKPFQEAWKKQYIPQKPTALPKDLARKMDVTIAIEAGKTALALQQWENAGIGDVIILDTCSLAATEGRDTVLLTLDGSPFFRGKVTPNGIQITEAAAFPEEAPQK